jgi:galactose-1-phosphate uridylyltransferase
VSQEQQLHLSEQRAAELEAPERLEELTWESAITLLDRQDGMDRFLPDGMYGLDPRSGETTIFNRSRARRPHDNAPRGDSPETRNAPKEDDCVICAGRTTSIIDRAPLSHGFTFINENLFPILHPHARGGTDGWVTSPLGGAAFGLHFLQWTSSYHHVDWPDLSPEDRDQVMRRLCVLEERLLNLPGYPGSERHVSIIKNMGRLVGGSLSHPHQQVALSNALPRRVRQNAQFRESHGQAFSTFMLERNPSTLTFAEFSTGRFMVPYFMRRPYNLLYVLENPVPSYLHQTSETERTEIGRAIAEGMRLMDAALDRVGAETAANIVVHTGPGAGIYLEFLPRTQADGGFEQLGLSACQSSPFTVAEQMRNALTSGQQPPLPAVQSAPASQQTPPTAPPGSLPGLR